MFNIALVDIGGDGCKTDFTTSVETLAEAEVIAAGEIGGHLGSYDVELIHDEDLVYEVISGGVVAGIVVIESL